ncbi:MULTISPECIES: hypothetical protein [Heyndrickxia]|uniref:hypothetical protein n=1 Tax=Heyndrickxia TaxID=2837504 RepID=UPI000779CA69|nr:MULTISPECIES: hypothetical protein [Heyndrickxia]KYC70552.1 hypothetical protein B4096_0199 [Heyndrickxia coagulans]
MGNKVEMTEVVSFSDELKSAASSLKSQLDAIKKSAIKLQKWIPLLDYSRCCERLSQRFSYENNGKLYLKA